MTDPWLEEALSSHSGTAVAEAPGLDEWTAGAFSARGIELLKPESFEQPQPEPDRNVLGYIGNAARAAGRGLGRAFAEAPPKLAAAGLSAADDVLMAFGGSPDVGRLSAEEIAQIRGSMEAPVDDPAGTLPAQRAYQLGEAGRKAAAAFSPVDPLYEGTLPIDIAETVGRAVPQAVTFAIAPPIGLMQGVGDTAVAAYERARRQGASEDKAKRAGYLTAPAGLLEAFGAESSAGKIIRDVDKATGGALWKVVSKVGQVLRGGTQEAGEELAQALVEEGVAQHVYETEPVKWDDVVRQTEIGGAAGSVLTGLALAVAGFRSRGNTASREAKLDETPSISPELGQTGANSPDLDQTQEAVVDSGGDNRLTGFQEPPRFVRLKPEAVADLVAVKAFVQQNPELAQTIAEAEFPTRTVVGQAVRGNLSKEQRAAFQEAVLEELTGPPAEEVSRRTPIAEEPGAPISREAPSVPVAEPSTAPVFGEAAGTAQLGAISTAMKRGYDGVKRLVRQLGTAPGDLPKPVYNLDVDRRRNFNEILAQGEFIERDFEAAMRKDYGSLATDARTRATVDAALKDPAALAALPPDIQDAARKARDHIDILSRRGINEGVFDSEVVPTIQENLGVYLHRQYRVFDDPAWADKVDPLVRNRFKSWLAAEYPNDTDNQLEQKINGLLYEGKAAQGPIAFLKNSKLGAKDLSILKGRTLNDFPELRALYGEYTDPMVNYAKSVVKMAALIENHHFLESVRADGMGKYLYDIDDPNIDPRASVRIAADASDPMHPLNGLRTYPEVEKAFRDAVAKQPEMNWWLRQYVKANVATKIAKTALSHSTQIRNMLGYATMLPAQGYWRVGKAYDALRATLEDLGVTANDKWRALILRATKLGIFRQGVQAGDLREMLSDLKKSDSNLNEVVGGWPVRVAKKAGRLALKLYGLGDDGPRLFAWLNEIERYRKAKPSWTQEQVEKYAADIVNRVLPTYEGLPKIVRELRHFPGGNTFLSFPAAMVKATYNTLKQAFSEMSSPDTRTIGAMRLAGFMAAKVAPKALALWAAASLGIDDKDDEAIRKQLAPWDENGTLLWLQKPSAENGWTAKYVNLSSLDPFGMFDRAIMAGMRGEDIASGFAHSAAEFMGNFIGEQIVFTRIVDVLRNKKGDTGGRVYNPTDDADEILGSVAAHLGGSLAPGSASSLLSLGKAVTGTETEKGKIYDPTTEMISQFGIRASKANLKTSILFGAKDYLDNKSLSEHKYTSKLFAAGPVDDATLDDSQQAAEKSRRAYFDEMHQELVELQGLGMTEHELRVLLKAAGVSEQHRHELMRGNYRPYSPSKQGIRARTKALDVTNPEAVERVRERVRER